MLTYLLKKLGVLVPTFFGVTFVAFLFIRLLPGDPVLLMAGERGMSEERHARLMQEFGYDRPVIVQYGSYLKDLASGDFGTSIITKKPVFEEFFTLFPATVELSICAMIIAVSIGLPAGIIAAVRRGSVFDHTVMTGALTGYSMPIFWIGLVGLIIFYGLLDWVGGPGRLDVYYEDVIPVVTGLILIDSLIEGDIDIFWNAFSHIILPASILGYYSLAYISRMTRSFMLEQLSQEYITTARVKGLSERTVIWRHALGNVMIPLITVIALSYANLLEGSVLTEIIFAWPGLGSYLTTALLSADMNAVIGGTVVVGLIFVGLNLLSDFLYKVVDPRAR